MAYFGEVNKWIGTSAVRVSKLSSNQDGIEVELLGSPDEALSVGFVSNNTDGDLSFQTVLCTVSQAGRVTLDQNGCVA